MVGAFLKFDNCQFQKVRYLLSANLEECLNCQYIAGRPYLVTTLNRAPIFVQSSWLREKSAPLLEWLMSKSLQDSVLRRHWHNLVPSLASSASVQCLATARIYPGITSVHTCLQETKPTIWNLLMKSGRCPRMKFASSLGVLLAIQIPSKHVETLLSQSPSLLRQNMHAHMHISISTLLSICGYNFQKTHYFIVSEYF